MNKSSAPGRGRLLVLAPNWLGDLVMTTPVLTLLSAPVREAGYQLVLGVRPAWMDLFRTDPRLDGVFPIHRQGRHAGVSGVIKLARDLARESYAGVLIGPPSLRMGVATGLAGIPLRVGYNSDGRGLLLNHGQAQPQRGSMHYSEELLNLGQVLLHALGISSSRPSTWPASSVPGCAATLTAAELQGPPLWVFAPGATFGSAKSWPLENMGQLVQRVRDRTPARIVFLGDIHARNYVQDLAARLDVPLQHELSDVEGLVDLTGRTDLARVYAILSAANFFVGNDSGLMHLAGALNVPTVGIFGSSNPAWTAPLGSRAGYVSVTDFPCHPCYRKTCNQPEFCLATVKATEVLKKLGSLSGLDPGGRQ